MIDAQNSVRPEPVEGPSFSSASAAKKGRGFDKLSPNGFGDVREQFPGLTPGWHYLDSAATAQKPQAVIDATVAAMGRDYRSEEHTSELQSLMRISYAVFCLKKK